MKVSAVLSIHNRSELFRRALFSYLSQTMGREDWEIILVDDGSTDALVDAYHPFLGQINLTHVRMDHTRHPIFTERNPGWVPGAPKDWFHTPALSINLGVSLAQGDVVCLCHPEIIHAPHNFEYAWRELQARDEYLFGKCYLGTQAHNEQIDKSFGYGDGWDGFISAMEVVDRPPDPETPAAIAREQETPYHPGYWYFPPHALYWYLSFLRKSTVERIGGVDFQYLHGVAGEDDDFRDRVELSGARPVAMHDLIQGFHQDHSHEQEAHRRRESEQWASGLARNRELYWGRKRSGMYPTPANPDYDWTAQECVVEIERHTIR